MIQFYNAIKKYIIMYNVASVHENSNKLELVTEKAPSDIIVVNTRNTYRRTKQWNNKVHTVITICIKYANTSKILTYILIPNKTWTTKLLKYTFIEVVKLRLDSVQQKLALKT